MIGVEFSLSIMSTKNIVCFFSCLVGAMPNGFAQTSKIEHDSKAKTVSFGSDQLRLTLDYNHKAAITSMQVRGQVVVAGETGVFSEIRTRKAIYSSLHLLAEPTVRTSGNRVEVAGIRYGNKEVSIRETWIFTLNGAEIQWDLVRHLSKAVEVEQVGFPVISFKNKDVWEGAYQDYGGLAWFYLFNKKLDTYGVHSRASDFWNSKTGVGLTLAVDAPGEQISMDYSRTAQDQLACRVSIARTEMLPRFDADTHRRRFVRDTTDVWAAFGLQAGQTRQRIRLSAFDFDEKYGRGKLVGLPGDQVSAVLNTIGRIGVIDRKHFGGNSWHTPYGPICLHEQYIAQMGLAINDPAYLRGYQECLDFYRDHAILPDGRVWPRWAYTNEDAMPKVFTDKGFYEAQWGYLLDSNPDLVTNVAELFDQTGDLAWVKTHQKSCEKALDWIIRRDSNRNGLVEMMTDSHQQKRGSDWIDIIWAAYENAFINAKLYRALTLWTGIERQLGNAAKARDYQLYAEKLKTTFNKPTTEGGFWDGAKKCYIHWRDKDGSTHGNNMVTPVNFMAIAYGICDDAGRKQAILDEIEQQMQRENLFFWPICLYTYAPGEGNDWQFPFPNYENGDLFLSWGATGVKAYAAYKPELALKYVKNVLAQYAKDGLAFQRYGRAKQDGLGDDILAGNCLSVVGLYDAIYGINPRYNRLYLDPHIAETLAGTQVNYRFRGQKLKINLNMGHYAVSNGPFKIGARTDFGFFATENELRYFHGPADKPTLIVKTAPKIALALDVQQWTTDKIAWSQTAVSKSSAQLSYQINGLKERSAYTIMINEKAYKQVKTNAKGTLIFDCRAGIAGEKVAILKHL